MSIFIVISILLHTLTLYFIFSLYQKQKQFQEEPESLYHLQQDLDEMLANYTKEIQRENRELKSMLSHSNGTKQQRKDETAHTQEEHIVTQRETANVVGKPEAETKENEYFPPEPEEGDKVEKSLQAEVLSLDAKGYTASDIAKKLQVGVTEVELLLKFHPK